MNGKGDSFRGSHEAYREGWDMIFGKKEEAATWPPDQQWWQNAAKEVLSADEVHGMLLAMVDPPRSIKLFEPDDTGNDKRRT